MRYPTPAEAEARKAASLDAMRRAESERMARAADARRAQREARTIPGCWICGSAEDLDAPSALSLALPIGRIEASTCKPCRATRGPMPELMARRLWEANPELPRRWGWVPIPSRRALDAVKLGHAVDQDGVPVTEIAWTVAEPWPPYCWAFRVLEARRAGEPDPKPPRRPFGWLR
jgi:hypothetical protein